MEVDEEEVMEVDEEIEVDWGQMDEEMGVMEKEMDGEIEVDGELRDEEQMDVEIMRIWMRRWKWMSRWTCGAEW